MRRENSRPIYSSDEESSVLSLHTEKNSKSKKKTYESMIDTLPPIPKISSISTDNNIRNADATRSSKSFININDFEKPCYSGTLRQSPPEILLNQNGTDENSSFHEDTFIENGTDGNSSFHKDNFIENNLQNIECESAVGFRKFVMKGIITLIKQNRNIAAKLESLEAQSIKSRHLDNANLIVDDSDEQLHEFEKSLRDKLFLRKLSLRLKSSGGQKLSLVAGVIMGKLMTDELAVGYSWQGRKGKKPINKLQEFEKLIKKTIQIMCPSSSDKEIEEAVGIWFLQASTRVKRAAAKN